MDILLRNIEKMHSIVVAGRFNVSNPFDYTPLFFNDLNFLSKSARAYMAIETNNVKKKKNNITRLYDGEETITVTRTNGNKFILRSKLIIIYCTSFNNTLVPAKHVIRCLFY